LLALERDRFGKLANSRFLRNGTSITAMFRRRLKTTFFNHQCFLLALIQRFCITKEALISPAPFCVSVINRKSIFMFRHSDQRF